MSSYSQQSHSITSLESAWLNSRSTRRPRSAKLHSLGFSEDESRVSDFRFSAWTPIVNKSSNQQLFQERTALILHWFDLWTDLQRKQFLHTLLKRCSKSQLKFTMDSLMEVVPITHMDFTTVLPRFLSLHIFSFLNPLELCQAAQVCWHWKFLAGQDWLWSPKCVRHGWFLPYSPTNNEYGAWKNHYINCVSSLHCLTPREASSMYGTLNEVVEDANDMKERQKERTIRQTIREKVAEHKKGALKSRRPWLSNSLSGGLLNSAVQGQNHQSGMSLTSALVLLGEKCRSQSSHSWMPENDDRLCLVESAKLKIPLTKSMRSHLPQSNLSPTHLLLLREERNLRYVEVSLCSDHFFPVFQLLLAGLKVSVIPLLYDHDSMTLEVLLAQAERLLKGRDVQSIAVVTGGSTLEIDLVQGFSITEKAVLNPQVREFWEKISGWVLQQNDGGTLDIFLPLAASASGMELMRNLSTLTGLNIRAPTGICTGSYHHILSEWSGSDEFPPYLYFNQGPFLLWCRQAEWLEVALVSLKEQLGPQLYQLRRETQGRMLGQFLCDQVSAQDICIRSQNKAADVIAEAFILFFKENPENPLEFLAAFVRNKYEEDCGATADTTHLTEGVQSRLPGSILELPQDMSGDIDRRTAVAKELLHSERIYTQLLETVVRVYFIPLKASLDSNRAILSSANILMMFSPVLDILEVNRVFVKELTERLQEWSPQQGIGDICKKLCTKLRTYTNFFNNYPIILRTVDKCREKTPEFRVFLKRHDRTHSTHMLSLQELLLAPFTRVQEYVLLLQALSVHTPTEHPDHAHLSFALTTMLNYRTFICKLKKSGDGLMRMVETQKMIQSCPNLQEGDRYLITTQEVALLNSPNEGVTASLRMYEHVRDLGLFLFSDALVLSERRVVHVPFSHALRSSHTFLASVALHSLKLRDIADTKYAQNAFALEGPRRQWICASNRDVDKAMFISALQSAINAAIHG
ncbi:epithelial cell-transforming sequence 2 oncogene-like [Denticeps clupeoides]|uniref:epithelial cell-transforming sequence 2 oncogene-like n=1 Tax=Denticeps clupeoides TaxID=299321 RepID=UPI0010A46795|nr:epithelial cell-transforming sequence 2 oncogene-like [Denticeps clupeoides]